MADLGSNPLLRRAFDRWPRLQPVLREINGLVSGRPLPTFVGWEMTTTHHVPWGDGPDWFPEVAEEVRRFEHRQPEHGETVDGLLWRHWNVAWSVLHAAEHTHVRDLTAVECGTGDGLTAHFAASAAKSLGGDWRLHLYDAWAEMLPQRLRPSEMVQAGTYADLSWERTARNLDRWSDRLTWHRGYIPDTLGPDAPDVCHWLHIDLNAADATEFVLEHFWPRIPVGGVVIFDDYGWRYHEDTRRTVDTFLADRPGTLLSLPTGQAIYFR